MENKYGSVSDTIAREPRKKKQPNSSTQRVILDIYALNIGALLEGTKQKKFN